MGKVTTVSHNTINDRHRIYLLRILCLFALCLPVVAPAQIRKGKPAKKKAEWMFLDHADELSYDQMKQPGVQIARGKVKFRFEDNTLDCDSAYFNQYMNTFQAFGHVRMHRATGNINLTCDRAAYNSMTHVFQARKGVVLTQPGNSLHCDSLDYNTTAHQANYFGHGVLRGSGSTVTSERGDYNTKSHDAHFTGKQVVLRSPEYNVTTPNLSYNTETKKGHVEGPSVIRTPNGEVIHTNNADFDGRTRSFATHGHSTVTSRERDIEGDNMDYNRSTGYGEGHGNVRVNDKQGGRIITGDNVKFRTGQVYKKGKPHNEIVEYEGQGHAKIIDKPGQRTIKGDYLSYNSRTKVGYGRGNVDYIDHKRKNAFLGDYVHYTELDAIAYGRAIVKDFSQGDTLFAHADTIKMKGKIENREIAGKTVADTIRTLYGIDNVRAYRTDVQAVCGLLVGCSRDSSMTLYQDPIVWNGSHQLVGDSIITYMNDSTIREAHVMGNAFSIEQLDDKVNYNQVSSKEMEGYFVDGKIRWGQATGNVLIIYYPVDDKDSSLIGLNYTTTDTMRVFMTPERKLQKIWMPKAEGTLYPMNQIPADRKQLRGFAWYDYIRPLDKNDLFRHVKKGGGNQQRQIRIAPPPLQYVDDGNTRQIAGRQTASTSTTSRDRRR